MILKFKKLRGNAILPKKQTEGAAGFDLYYCPEKDEELTLYAGGTSKLVPTGIAAEVPSGYFLMVCSRSGMALNHSVSVHNSPGICDCDYRGEIGVILYNAGKYDYHIKPGDRIAQLIVAQCPTVSVKITDELSKTERGEGGFGSTGK